ncbi:MAG TPA: 2-dehydropantoate 2-reductase [Ottowia sp.]|nr:2-dehydropantoate 2-reductase [Ottowia sp.]HMT16294.1 2-dehydropantoate 2-reductase [Ottowia sp.]HMT63421.1 2-dehydropantoate 2-reductase [Ottowia sp.]HOM20476.1 2-dehydropantoate 2-reductase [Ottowia sp.]HPP96581.1 2-dehydropantoate 2-reductase [Ottowia sp.]
MTQKICIYGAGAIGGWLGARLAAQGGAVSAVARGATLAALRTHGLRLREAGADGAVAERAFAVQASDSPFDLGPQDLVIVAVKAPAMAEVARAIAPLLGPDTAVLTAMNGVPWWFLQGFGGPLAGTRLESVDPGGAIAQAIDARRVIGCVVHASCSVDEPGVIRRHFGNGLIVGEPAGGDTPRLASLAALLRQAGFDTTVSAQIQKDVWYKLWGNMTINPISAFTGATADRILDDDLARGFVSAVMLEAREIGARIGVPIDQTPEDRHAVTRKLGAFKPSMLQDVEAGRSVELDALVASVRELGQLTGVATPFTDALLGLARLHARVRGLYV